MIRQTMKVGAALAVAAGVALLASPVVSATPAGGPVHLFGTPANKGGGTVLLTGAIGDHGKATNANASGKPQKKGTYTLLVLKKGTILVNTTKLNADANNPNTPPTSFNTSTCSGYFTVTDPVPVVHGTKLYQGIAGSLNVTLTFALVFPLQKGTCNMGNNGPNPSAQYGTISGSGSVSF